MIDELRHFLLVVEHGTFTEAARRAHLSQPALSASIARLERHYGATLLHRDRHGASPTAAGEALRPRARSVLAALAESEHAVQELMGLRAGEVRLGGGATACSYLLPRWLMTFRAQHPGVRVRLREAPTGTELREAVRDGSLDLAIVAGDEGERWYDDALILVAGVGVDAATAPVLTFPVGANTRALVDRYLPEREVVMELSSIATLKSHARAGMGVALLSRAAVENDLAQGRLVEVRDPRMPLSRTLRLVHRGVERLSPGAAALRTLLLSETPKRRRGR